MSEPRVLAVDAAGVVEEATAVLRAGGLVVLPTDTVYGLAAAADLPEATARIFPRKGRTTDVPVAVLCADAEQALSLAEADDRARALADRHWPGPLTLVLARRAGLGWALGEPEHTIGLRCPDNDFVRSVARAGGPLAVTSANRHGVPTPPTAIEAAASLLGTVDLVVDGGRLEGLASTVVDATGTELEVLRQGSVVL